MPCGSTGRSEPTTGCSTTRTAQLHMAPVASRGARSSRGTGAWLTAAWRLTGAGKSVMVLEARDRVGGRVWTQAYDGFRLDFGGTFLGPDQDAVRKLVSEFGLDTFPTHYEGDKVITVDGEAKRYSGLIPKINPLAVAS